MLGVRASIAIRNRRRKPFPVARHQTTSAAILRRCHAACPGHAARWPPGVTPHARTRPCCAGVFTSTRRMVGRLAASTIAAASAMSFFRFLTCGLTTFGAISRRSCPVMGGRTCRHRHPASRMALHERKEPFARTRRAEPDCTLGRCAMQVKDLPGQVHANDRYALHGRLFLILQGSQGSQGSQGLRWHKRRQAGRPDPSSKPGTVQSPAPCACSRSGRRGSTGRGSCSGTGPGA